MVSICEYLADRRRAAGIAALLTVIVAVLASLSTGDAKALVHSTELLPGGVQRIEYWVGPINVTPGQNRIENIALGANDRPPVDGWITRIKPNLVDADGTVPDSSQVMFHHGVWMNMSGYGAGYSQQFYATGEEKTILDLPDGYGLRYRKLGSLILNHMIHNLVFQARTMYITYTVDFIPDSAPEAAGMTEVKPIWMDVEAGPPGSPNAYPVFDVFRDSGSNGKFTYPQDADRPYQGQWGRKNEQTIQHDGVLINTTGHVHTGGLSTELYLNRTGAKDESGPCVDPGSFTAGIVRRRGSATALAKQAANARSEVRALKRQLKRAASGSAGQSSKLHRSRNALRRAQRKLARLVRRQKVNAGRLRAAIAAKRKAAAGYADCLAAKPEVQGSRAHLFDSKAVYFDPRGPISWDMSMRTTPDDWKVQVKQGDKLELQTTYETELASWYESMGIDVVYMAEEAGGRDPYRVKVSSEGVLNHGHTSENEDYGGEDTTGLPDAATLPDGLPAGGPITTGGQGSYTPGGLSLPGNNGYPPVVQQGERFTFQMSQGSLNIGAWHSITSCKSPCNKSTGISYPIPDGQFQFDSGQMGTGGPPTVNRTTWQTPADLPPGTYTFYCRIHPVMRGAIRVKPAPAPPD